MYSQDNVDRKAYNLAKSYLLNLNVDGLNPDLIDKYLHLSEIIPKPNTLSGIYERLLESAQNANMRAGVIGGSIGGVNNLSKVLSNFSPTEVISAYGNRWEDLLDDIVDNLNPRGEIRRTPRSIWPLFCKSTLSGAQFLSQFDNAEDFYSWVDFFDKDDRARPALPMLISYEVIGIGFPLACDFLKELGYVNFAKPDVHLRDIFQGLNLCPDKSSDYQIFTAIVRVAKNNNVSPYNVDKMFWLVGSGNFYDDPQIGNKGRVPTNKQEFIEAAYKKLYSE